jgi:hypothetical protein
LYPPLSGLQIEITAGEVRQRTIIAENRTI